MLSMEKKNINVPKVVIIILNWNGWSDSIECLESLYQINYQNYDVILVDNGSKDGSLEKIKDYCFGKIKVDSPYFSYRSKNKPIFTFELNKNQLKRGERLKSDFFDTPTDRRLILISLKKNIFFTGGNNIGCTYGLKTLKPDYILLLNNDTVVEKKFLNELIEISEKREEIGIIGPEIRYYDKPNEIQFGRIYKKFTDPSIVDFISGCAFLIKTKVVKSIGLFDPLFFNYYEEVDYIYRAKKAGYEILYVPTKNKVFHKHEVSSKKIPGFVKFFSTRNYIICTKKHSNTNKEFYLEILRFFKIEIKKYMNAQSILFFKKYKTYYFLKGVLTGLILSIFREKNIN